MICDPDELELATPRFWSAWCREGNRSPEMLFDELKATLKVHALYFYPILSKVRIDLCIREYAPRIPISKMSFM